MAEASADDCIFAGVAGARGVAPCLYTVSGPACSKDFAGLVRHAALWAHSHHLRSWASSALIGQQTTE